MGVALGTPGVVPVCDVNLDKFQGKISSINRSDKKQQLRSMNYCLIHFIVSMETDLGVTLILLFIYEKMGGGN